MFDFIGDVHGCAGHLLALLVELGYQPKNGTWWHPERKAFFIGDFIDRGENITEALQIVRGMVESGNAIALMGNHEFNAICFNMPGKEGGYLRKHSIQNMIQHSETIKQFKKGPREYRDYIAWFRTLPLFYECESFRAVHACWDHDQIILIKSHIDSQNLISKKGVLRKKFFEMASGGDSIFSTAIEDTLKGKGIKLPDDCRREGNNAPQRNEMRIRWWLNPDGITFKNLGIHTKANLSEKIVEPQHLKSRNFYGEDEKPVFFGHYWLRGKPELLRDNVCCLDYSAANDGKLVAYRFNGETRLHSDRFVYV